MGRRLFPSAVSHDWKIRTSPTALRPWKPVNIKEEDKATHASNITEFRSYNCIKIFLPISFCLKFKQNARIIGFDRHQHIYPAARCYASSGVSGCPAKVVGRYSVNRYRLHTLGSTVSLIPLPNLRLYRSLNRRYMPNMNLA